VSAKLEQRKTSGKNLNVDEKREDSFWKNSGRDRGSPWVWPAFAELSELSDQVARKGSKMSKTGKLYSPNFKEVAIRLVHSSEDPHFSFRPHLRNGISNLANQVVDRGRSGPERYHARLLQNSLLENHSRCWRLAYGARFP
jgi:hypothetical protein